MKLIRMFIAFVTLSLIVGLGNAFNGQDTSTMEETSTPQQTETKETNVTKESEVKENEENLVEEEQEVQNQTVQNDNTSNQEQVPKIEETKPVEETQKSVNNQDVINNSVEKENTIWEDLGITEDEYYNSPMMKWQKVTHNSFSECQKDGDEATKVKINSDTGESYQDYHQYWCYEVNSYSGKLLGVMLKLS